MNDEMTTRMETRTDANYEKSEVLRNTVVSRMDIYQARTEDSQEEIIAKMDAHWERMEASINAWRTNKKKTAACQEATEVCLQSKEPTSVETESVAVHEDVPKEEDCRHGPRAIVAAASRGMTHRAIPTPRKGQSRQ
jgi:hypothetical protein